MIQFEEKLGFLEVPYTTLEADFQNHSGQGLEDQVCPLNPEADLLRGWNPC